VHVPSALGEQSLSQVWPEAQQRLSVLEWLSHNGCADGEDLLEGACVPLACLLAERGIHMLGEGTNPADVPDAMHQTCILSLTNQTAHSAASLVFGPLCARGWKVDAGLWDSKYFDVPTADLVFGSEQATLRIRQACDGPSLSVVPLYLLCYIYDGNELTDVQMRRSPMLETAQYSVHAVSLIVVPGSRSIIVGDPNGALVPGSNMEFVSMPPRPRGTKGTTTCRSRFDRDTS
jgi:hypothetical protein